jgi:hypothetical protein
MNSFALLGLCAVVVMAFCAFAAAPSASAVEWVTFECAEVAHGTGLWADSKCHEKTIGGNFERLKEKGLETEVASTSTFTLALEDMGTGVKIECSGIDEGVLGPHTKGKFTGMTFTLATCKVLAGSGTCKKILAVNAVDLPWGTNLFGSPVRNEITAGGAGAPGWLIECESLLGIKVDDTCIAALSSTAMSEGGSGVTATYDSASGEANCSVGGEKQGLTIGTDSIVGQF